MKSCGATDVGLGLGLAGTAESESAGILSMTERRMALYTKSGLWSLFRVLVVCVYVVCVWLKSEIRTLPVTLVARF